MTRLSGLLSFLGFAYLFTACSSVPRICEPENARNAGFGLAMQGHEIAYAAGETCLDEHRATFRQHFEKGYQEGRMRYCNPAEVEKVATQKGQAGVAAKFEKTEYRICESTADLAAAYKKGYATGLADYCKDERATEAGRAHGEAGGGSSFPDEKYAVCVGKLGKLRAAYSRGFKEGNANFCKAEKATEQGMKDGGQGIAAADIETRFKACSSTDRRRIGRNYNEGYQSAFLQFCASTNIDAAARDTAQKSTTPALPQNYALCFEKFPDLQTQFEKTFHEERNRVVEAKCTYQGGMSQGSVDARSGNDKKTEMPVYCNQALYGVYLQGYLEGWKTTKAQACNPNEAYSEGVRRGQFSSAVMETYNPPANCPAEFGVAMTEKFREGYQYAQNLKRQGQGLSGGLASQDYECKTEVTNRSGTIDISRCGNASNGRIACYQDVRETCRHRQTGATQVKNQQSFDGRCVSSFSSCW